MNLQELKQILIEYENKFILRGQQSYQLSHNKLLFNELNNKYFGIFRTIQEIIYLLENKDNLENLHIFCKCGNKNRFIRYKKGYTKHCCCKCNTTDPNTREKNSIGVRKACSLKTKEQKYLKALKISNSRRNRTAEQKQSTFKKQSLASKIMWANKTKDDIKSMGRKISDAHSKRTRQQKDESILKYKNSMNKKSIEEKKEILRKISLKLKSRTKEQLKETYKKSLSTKIKNDTLPSSNKVRNKIKITFLNKTIEEKDNIKRKIYETKKKNGTLGGYRSKSEIRCYEKVKVRFNKAEYSYYDEERYPFNCDIYVPELDLFIECHFGVYHHYHPFNDNNIGDLVELSKMHTIINSPYYLDDQKKFYKNIINCWVDKDKLKLKTFQDNKLNYKIFYTEKEFNDWFDSL